MRAGRGVAGAVGLSFAALALSLSNPAPAQAAWTNYWIGGTYENVTKWSPSTAMNGGAVDISTQGFLLRLTTQGWGYSENYDYVSSSYSMRTTRQYCYWTYPPGEWPGWLGMTCDYSH